MCCLGLQPGSVHFALAASARLQALEQLHFGVEACSEGFARGSSFNAGCSHALQLPVQAMSQAQAATLRSSAALQPKASSHVSLHVSSSHPAVACPWPSTTAAEH